MHSGAFNYGDDRWRPYCRSTAAHNVLQVDDENQRDVWSQFRTGYCAAFCRPQRHSSAPAARGAKRGVSDVPGLPGSSALAPGHAASVPSQS